MTEQNGDVRMDIRIIKSQKGSSYRALAGNQVLSISEGTNRLGDYVSRKLERYDTAENWKEEIAPEIMKYNIWDIRVLQRPEGCFYFTSCYIMEKNQIMVELYCYHAQTKESELIYEEKENLLLYPSQKRTVLYILNENYFLIQHMYVRSNELENYSGFLDFELKLYSIVQKREFLITDASLCQAGIEQIEMVTKNVCAIKTGVNLLEDDRYQFLTEKEVFPERIGFVNLQQFISDILLKQENVCMDLVEETRWDKTLLHMHVEEQVLMYSRMNIREEKEEVIFFHHDTKEINLCEKQGISQLKQIADTCVIDGIPYIRLMTLDGITFYNVQKGSRDIHFGKEKEMKLLAHGLLVVQEKKKSLPFFRPRYLCEVYKLPGREKLISEKSELNCAMIPDAETVFLFTK